MIRYDQKYSEIDQILIIFTIGDKNYSLIFRSVSKEIELISSFKSILVAYDAANPKAFERIHSKYPLSYRAHHFQL